MPITRLGGFILICTMSCLAITLIVFGDPFLVGMLAGFGIFLACVLAAVSVLGLVLLPTRRSTHKIGQFLRISAIAIAFLGSIALLNPLANELAVESAKEYPEKVAPLLEAFKSEHGLYPRTLDDLPQKPPALPRLLRTGYGYRSDGNTYWFTFPQPGGLIDTWDYSSETREWWLST